MKKIKHNSSIPSISKSSNCAVDKLKKDKYDETAGRRFGRA